MGMAPCPSHVCSTKTCVPLPLMAWTLPMCALQKHVAPCLRWPGPCPCVLYKNMWPPASDGLDPAHVYSTKTCGPLPLMAWTLPSP